MPVTAAHRRAAWPRLGLLAASVLLLHGGLASHWQRASPPALGQRDNRPLAVRLLPLPRPAAPAAAPPLTGQGAAPAAEPAVPARDAKPAAPAPAAKPAVPAPAARPDAPARGAVAAVARRVQGAAPGPTLASLPDAQHGPDVLAGADAADLPGPAGPSGAPGAAASTTAGEPPPVYATLLPAPALLHYVVLHHGQPGQARLVWRPDGPRYALTFDARLDRAGSGSGGATPALIEQASQGGFDAAGLAPERFTDRRRGRGWRAANFQREVGRIRFSGPSVEYPAWPGTQDRLSWLVQLVAIRAAATLPLAQITLWVVDAGGGAARWRFVDQGDEPVETPLGWVAARHWQHQPDQADQPARPDGQRVDVWLAPGLGHWPAQLRVTSLRTGDETLWRLAASPAPP